MYTFITGKVTAISPTSVVVENNGMGYHIHITLNTYSKIKDLKEVRLLTYCILKNETQAVSNFAIFGFVEESERMLFLDLISVSGVGNNTAQLILSSFEPGSLLGVIGSGDAATLQRVKGIGAKTAQRIIIDLKDKAGKQSLTAGISLPAGNTLKSESLSALLTLGFGRVAAEKAVDKAIGHTSGPGTPEEVIKLSLGFLAS
ncbi:MAG TPA: Holliday junction branch migration protein RuvA [Bacteroidia bacterium]|nr:Holliday junction branch migration protein RuvA [Bacteroidia bacterium]